MNPALILGAAWLLVIGYGLVYIGYQNQAGHSTSFKDAFLPLVTGAAKSQAPIVGTSAIGSSSHGGA